MISLPEIGKFNKSVCVVRFIRSLRCLYKAGVDMNKAWGTAFGNTDNIVIQKKLSRSLPCISSGESLREAFMASGIFSPKIISMVAAGEKSANVAPMLDKVADMIEKDLSMIISAMVIILPLFLYLGIAVYIGYMVISFYSDYFSKIMDVGV